MRAREALNQSFPSKRVNHEALGKARAWITAFGRRQIVPCAVLSGPVFNPSNLDSAQAEGLTIIWSHRLQDRGPREQRRQSDRRPIGSRQSPPREGYNPRLQ